MGELAEDFRFMKEQALKERASKEPSRFEHATDLLMDKGFRVGLNKDDSKALMIETENGDVTLWPYKGWWSGKGIGSGRGVHNLLKKLENK